MRTFTTTEDLEFNARDETHTCQEIQEKANSQNTKICKVDGFKINSNKTEVTNDPNTKIQL